MAFHERYSCDCAIIVDFDSAPMKAEQYVFIREMKARLSMILIFAIQSLTFGDGMSFWNELHTVSQ